MPRNIVWLMVMLGFSLLATPLTADAQQEGTVPRIGYLGPDAADSQRVQDLLNRFRDGLRELGWVEGQNLAIEYRWAEGRAERLPALAAELVRLPVDVLVVHGPPSVRAAREATNTIPIVMARMDDVDEHGFVASLARPGGNITGLSFQTGELSGKWLEFLHAAVPSLARVAVLWDAAGTENQRRTLEDAAHAMGVHLQMFAVRSPEDFDGAFAAAHTAQAAGIVILASQLLTQHVPRLAALAAQHRLPTIYYHRRFAETGGLMAYGPKEADPSFSFGRAAVFVDKILKGTKPADLPVERPIQFELVLNLKTAQALGLTLSPALLILTDEVIK